jgi:hypothetical protein
MNLGLGARQPGLKLGDPGALVEEGLPVLGRPGVATRPQQHHDIGLVTR